VNRHSNFQVYFQQRSTAKYFTCEQMEISIQSVRWPVTRFTQQYKSEYQERLSCQSRQTCSKVDATIWVVPRCSSTAGKVDVTCSALWKQASCFPYCMASRVRGSGAQSLVLFSASDWKNAVHVVKRDCVSAQPILNDPIWALTQDVKYNNDHETPVNTGNIVSTTVANNLIGGSIQIGGKQWDDKYGCIASDTARSIIGINLHPMYNHTKPAFRSILMIEQPFAMTGDTTLTSVKDGSGQYFVKVDRLYGNEANDFTMVNVMKEFPANPPAETIEMGGNAQSRVDKLPIPYAYSDARGTRHPAASSRSSVFFAVNPSLAMFKAFGAWCLSGSMDAYLQYSALSSYAPIRVWKIDPYIYCPNGADGTTECEPGHVGFVDIPDAFTEIQFDANKCDVPFSVAVTSLEYIDANNIAVSILKAPMNEYDIESGLLKPGAKNSVTEIMFLNTDTMGLRNTLWQERVEEDLRTIGLLCPAMRRLPNLGSLTTELVVAGVSLVRFTVNMIVSLPGS
jgi:hypothetical protein